jgi:hypothetical protein
VLTYTTEFDVQDVMQQALHGQDILAWIVGNLPVARGALADDNSCMTPSPVKENAPAPAGTSRQIFKEVRHPLKCSCEISPEGMVSAFVSAHFLLL